jgi:D-sedoheptulose 7-phosphate isomerase
MSLFPDRPYPDAGLYADAYFELLAVAVASVDRAAIVRAAELLVERVRQGGRIFACGNGGSAAIANHLVCDHLKGIRSNTALRPQVHSFSSSVELITAIANDIGAEEMFAFQLSSRAGSGPRDGHGHDCDDRLRWRASS